MITAYKLMMVKDSNTGIPSTAVDSPQAAIAIIQSYLQNLDREEFVAVALDIRLKPIGINTVAIGSLDSAIVHPREVFKFAILANAASLILGHNHPSGDPSPSKEDIELTKRLVDAGKILGIDIVDHIIVSEGDRYYSLKQEQQM